MYRVGQLGACGLSAVQNQEVSARGRLISSVVISIGAIASVCYREVVRSWEGPFTVGVDIVITYNI